MHMWLHQHGKSLPRTEMSEQRRRALLTCFGALDLDGGGTIDRHEFLFAVGQLGWDTKDIHEALANSDADDDGQLTFDEFCALIARLGAMGALDPSSAMRSVDDVLDKAASFPLSIVANASHLRSLVDQYNPARQAAAEQAAAGAPLSKATPLPPAFEEVSIEAASTARTVALLKRRGRGELAGASAATWKSGRLGAANLSLQGLPPINSASKWATAH